MLIEFGESGRELRGVAVAIVAGRRVVVADDGPGLLVGRIAGKYDRRELLGSLASVFYRQLMADLPSS